MTTMKAVTFREFGPPSVLSYEDVQIPQPGPAEVRVRLTVSGMNPTDWKSRGRQIYGDATVSKIPHHDGVGTIDAIGADVDSARIGRRVWVYFAARPGYRGTAAQYTTVPSSHAIDLSASVSDEVGASLGIPALTAHHALGDLALLKDATVVVNGFGAVGFAAMELALWAGARVVCTSTSPQKWQTAQQLGASGVVDPADADALDTLRAMAPGGAVRIVEPALGSNLVRDLGALRAGGSIGVYATEGEPLADFPTRAFLNLNAHIDFTTVFGIGDQALAKAARDITDALSQGYLRGYPIISFALEKTAAAHDAMADGAFAKAVITIP